MSKLLEELELKFKNIETKIEIKSQNINNLCIVNIELLEKNFNVNELSEKYSNELNNQRQLLLNQVTTNLGLEIANANEILTKRNETNKERSLTEAVANFKTKRDFKKPKSLCICKLLINEFKFSKQFDTLHLIKYKNILGISGFIIRDDSINETKIYDKALVVATLRGDLEILKNLVENGVDVNEKISFNKTALMLVADRLKFVKYLVENGADVNAKDINNNTALIYSCINNRLEIVKYLVEHGADVNAKGQYDYTALITASRIANLEMVKYLVENGANVNAKNKDDKTALVLASQNNLREIEKYLVENVGLH